jgi:sugar O-acyltransferase (sialic acid O-acetyltransferase NeuD family)
MKIKKLTVLGKSDATITMILDNLESCKMFPKIEIINNLNLPIIHELNHPKFFLNFSDELKKEKNLVLGVFKSQSKLSIIKNFSVKKENFLTIIHNTSSISKTSVFGYGVLINSLVSIAAHTEIGDFVSINRNASIGHHTTINNFVTINPGVNIAGHVNIGANSLIGMGANIIDGIKIGENSIIGAGSVVTKDIPDNVVAYGNPCKIIRDNKI